MQIGLPGAMALPQHPTGPNPVEAAIAEGKKLRENGRLGESCKAFERASEAAHEIGNVEEEAQALVFLSGSQIRLFEYRSALESAQQARQFAQEAKNNALAGLSETYLASIYTQLGDFPLAEKEAAESVRLLETSPRKDLLSKALLSYALIQILNDEIAGGEKSSDQAIAVAQKASLPAVEGTAWDYRGISLLLQDKIAEAEIALKNGLHIRQKINDLDGLALSEEHQAELELKKKPKPDYSAALKWIDEAFASPSATFKTSPQYYPIHIRGKILLGLGKPQQALAEFRRAVDAANAWREGALPGDITSTRTVDQLHDVYYDYALLAANLSLTNHDAALARQALQALGENRAASLRDELTAALNRNFRLPPRYFALLSELQAVQARVTLGTSSKEDQANLRAIRIKLDDFENQIGILGINAGLSAEKIHNKNSLRNIQFRLSKDEILLSFGLGKEKSFLWAVTRDDVNLYELPPEAEIVTRVQSFSESVLQGEKTPTGGQRLSQTLFGKLRRAEWEKPDWLIVADGPLQKDFPIAALPTAPASGRAAVPLIESHTLRFVPSQRLLLVRAAGSPQGRFLGVADPIYNAADARRLRSPGQSADLHSAPLARLVGSDREIRSAVKVAGMPDSEILVGAQASAAGLSRALEKTPEVLHFAVHVVSPPGRPEEAALALSLSSDGLPELLTPEAVAALRVPGTLVIMSGCSSEQGKALPSTGVVGLSRAWLLAGAAAVIVSAWPTPDDSGQFFSAFYSHLQRLSGGSLARRAARALQEAQLEMERGGGYRSSPSFWAAYSIVSKE